jgi:hypothetical protein
VVSHLFQAADNGVLALVVAAAVILGAGVLRVETKMAPTMTTRAKPKEMCHITPSNPLSNPCLREGKGKGNQGKDGGHCRRRWW